MIISMEYHCELFALQHESATRSVDKTVWEEIRNFKKCLIMMFAKQEKDVVFLETVVGLGKQRRHCLIECIPLPQGIAKEAPLYFKKVRVLFFFVPFAHHSKSFQFFISCVPFAFLIDLYILEVLASYRVNFDTVTSFQTCVNSPKIHFR